MDNPTSTFTEADKPPASHSETAILPMYLQDQPTTSPPHKYQRLDPHPFKYNAPTIKYMTISSVNASASSGTILTTPTTASPTPLLTLLAPLAKPSKTEDAYVRSAIT